MKPAWKKLIVALDLEDKAKIRRVVRSLAPYGVKFKIGSLAFTKFGPGFVRSFIKQGVDIFLDLKLYDIPNTMRQSAAVITELGVWAFTVHIQAGAHALLEVKKEVRARARRCGSRRPKVLGVTVLTSQASGAAVMKRVEAAAAAGLDGVIASPQEAAAIKKKYKRLTVVTPGIRLGSAACGDQQRVASAQSALNQGADYIVCGRPIIQQKDPLAAAQKLLQG